MSGDNLKEDAVQATATQLRMVHDPPSQELERLFQTHYDTVFRAAYRVTGSADDAEDVLQTVFLRLVKREEVPDLSPSPAAYFHRAAINASLDLLRSRTRAKSVGLDDVEGELPETNTPNPESEQETRELRKLLRGAVARLEPRAAEIFTLRYFEGYGNNEIAEMLGTSQMVVGVVLHRSRARLRKEIGKFLEVQ